MLLSFDVVGGYRKSVLIAALLVIGAIFLFFYIYILPTSSIAHLRGPPPQSWLLGNMRELESSVVGACEFKWAKRYGQSYRLKGGFGEDVFMTSDPLALQYILQTCRYNVVRPAASIERYSNLLGKSSVLTTDGSTHKRIRRVMSPAFGLPEAKALTHVFQSKAAKLVSQWKTAMKDSDSLECNVHRWLARATMDAIGEAAFGYQFGTMDNRDNKLGRTYEDMFITIGGYPSFSKMAWLNFTYLLPVPLLWLTRVPTKEKRWVNNTRSIMREVAGKLLDEEWSVVDDEKGGSTRNAMSLLVQANSAEVERNKLTRQEVIDQMGALILGGHETTSNTLAFALWELAKNQIIQNALRMEILRYLRKNSDEGIPATQYEEMECTTSFIKEVLRMHPILPKIVRRAVKDIVVPLSDPIKDEDGFLVDEVLLKKGTRIFGNVVAYNRNPNLWGSDPDAFRPGRWSDMKENKVKFGVYENLGAFGAGAHACLGWRFALYETQSFIIAMLQNFRFELTLNEPKVRRTFANVMVPQVEGDEKHVMLPLKVIKLGD